MVKRENSGFWQSGKRAYRAGIRFEDCPLAKGSQARREWQWGHRWAANWEMAKPRKEDVITR